MKGKRFYIGSIFLLLIQLLHRESFCQVNCVTTSFRNSSGQAVTIGYADGALQVKNGLKTTKFFTQQNFLECLDFDFQGLYIKTGDNNWEMNNVWMNDSLMIITPLDEAGRSLLFILDIKDEKLFTGEKNTNDFSMPRFNRIYFDPITLRLAAAGSDQMDYQSEDVATPIYFNRLEGEVIKFDGVKILKAIDYNTVIAPNKIFDQ